MNAHAAQAMSPVLLLARRRLLLAAACSAGLAAVGCASSPATRLYELRLEPPEPFTPMPAGDDSVWELSPSVSLPAALDRDTLVVASGNAGLEPLPGHRWAAPLRDSIPRLLLHDLQRLRGPGRVWAAPVPAGVQPTQRLRVELLALQAGADRSRLRLQAQWWWQAAPQASGASASANTRATAPGAAPPPVTGSSLLDIAVADTSIDALASAHRLALWRLAQQLVQTAPGRA